MKDALGRIAAVSLASAVAAGSLTAVGKLIVYGDLGIPRLAMAPEQGDLAPIVQAAESPSPTLPPAPSMTAAPTPTATPAPTPISYALTPFRFGGRSYLGVRSSADTPTFVAPFAGTVEIRRYQFIDGQVRVGSNVASLPFFPYIAVVSAERRMTFRPGALDSVTEVLVADGATVTAGQPLFRIMGSGRSSWATFYDSRADYQVVVSLQTVPAGRDLDPAVYFN